MQAGGDVSRIGNSRQFRRKRDPLAGVSGAALSICPDRSVALERHRCRECGNPRLDAQASTSIEKRRIRMTGRQSCRARPPVVEPRHQTQFTPQNRGISYVVD